MRKLITENRFIRKSIKSIKNSTHQSPLGQSAPCSGWWTGLGRRLWLWTIYCGSPPPSWTWMWRFHPPDNQNLQSCRYKVPTLGHQDSHPNKPQADRLTTHVCPCEGWNQGWTARHWEWCWHCPGARLMGASLETTCAIGKTWAPPCTCWIWPQTFLSFL